MGHRLAVEEKIYIVGIKNSAHDFNTYMYDHVPPLILVTFFLFIFNNTTLSCSLIPV